MSDNQAGRAVRLDSEIVVMITCWMFWRRTALLVLSVGLLSVALPMAMVTAEVPDFEVERGADPLPVPQVVGRETSVPPRPVAIPVDDLLAELPEVDFRSNGFAARSQSVVARDPVFVGDEYPTLVSPTEKVIAGRDLALRALRNSSAVSSTVEYTIVWLGVELTVTSLDVEATCNRGASVWTGSGLSDAFVEVNAALVADEGFYFWCARHGDGGSRWNGTLIEASSVSALGLLGLHANHANRKNVNVATGNWVMQRTDVALPSMGPELAVRRVYNSMDSSVGAFGLGWSFNYDMSLTAINDGDLLLTQPDGASVLYVKEPDGPGWTVDPSSDETAEVSRVANTFVLRHRDGGSHEFDAGLGRLSAIKDAWGNAIALEYNEQGKLAFARDQIVANRNGELRNTGRFIEFEWGDGRIVRVSAPDPRLPLAENGAGVAKVSWTYDYVGNQRAAGSDFLYSACEPRYIRGVEVCEAYQPTDPSSGVKIGGYYREQRGDNDDPVLVVDVRYDSDGRVQTLIENPAGADFFGTTFEYSPVGDLLSADSVVHRVCTTKVVYGSPAPDCSTARYSPTKAWDYLFDGRARLRQHGPAGSTPTRYTYDEAGRRTRITDPMNNTAELYYDDGDLIAERNGEGELTFYGYDNVHDLVAVCDHRAAINDGRDNPPRFEIVVDYCVQMTYRNHSLIERVTHINGTVRDDIVVFNKAIEKWGRDPNNGLVLRESAPITGERRSDDDPEGFAHPEFDVTSFNYSASGDLLTRTAPSGLATTYKRNSWAAPTKVSINRDGADVTVAEYQHDEVGHVIRVSGPATTNEVSGQQRRLVTVQSWNALGLLHETNEISESPAGVSDLGTRVTTFAYDALGREVSVTDAVGKVTSRTFDADGNVAAVCDARNNCQATTYGNDNLPDAVTAIDYNGTGVSQVLMTTNHDAAGRLISSQATDRSKRVFRYDKADRLVFEGIEGVTWPGPDGAMRQRTRRLNEYVYDAENKTGFMTLHLTGGENDEFGTGVRTIRKFDHTWSGLVKKESIGVNVDGRGGAEPSWIEIQYAYAASGRITSETLGRALSPRQTQTRWLYEHGNVTRVKEAIHLSGTESYIDTYATYDERGVLESTSDTKRVFLDDGPRDGEPRVFEDVKITTNYHSDDAGRIYKVVSPEVDVYDDPSDNRANAAARRERPEIVEGFNAWGELTHTRDERGHETVTTRGLLGRPLHIQHPAVADIAPTEGFGYDANGNVAYSVSRRGYTTFYFYDDFNRVTAQSRPMVWTDEDTSPTEASLVSPTRFEYDYAGNRTKVIDPEGAVTTYTYNELDVIETSTLTARQRSAGGHTIPATTYRSSFTYDAAGKLETSTINGRTTVRKWNTVGELSEITEIGDPADPADDATWRYTYNALGDIVTEIDPTGKKMVFCYDGRGNLEVTKLYSSRRGSGTDNASCDRNESASTPRELQWKTQTRYTQTGRVQANVDAQGNATSFRYDNIGRLTHVAEPAVEGERAITRYGYDKAGNPTFQSDGRDNVTRHTYNAWNLRESTTDANGHTWTIGYDGGGLSNSLTDPTGDTISRYYTALGQLSAEDVGGAARTYAYDDLGRLVGTRSGADAEQRFAYDERGALFFSDGPQGRSEYTFHGETGLLKSRKDPSSANAHTFDWDNRQRLQKHGDAVTGEVSEFGYDQLNRLVSESRSSSGITSYDRVLTYDKAGRLDTDTASDRRGELIHRSAYEWTPNGDIDTETVSMRATGPGFADRVYDYDYDGARRLTSWSINEGGRDIHTEAYRYDEAGNRTAVRRTTGARSRTDTWTYDPANRMTESSVESTYSWNDDGTIASITGPAGVDTFSFNGFGQLTERRPADQDPINYTYDPLGRLATRDNDAFAYAGQTADPASYGTNLAYGRSPNGTIRSYASTNDANAVLPVDVHLNYRGDITHERRAGYSNLTAAVVRNPYGRLIEAESTLGNNAPTVSSLGYQGDFTDPATGDVNMGARWYNPTSATFRSRDTYAGELRTPISLNRYTYAANNPARYWDPSGMCFVPVQGAPACSPMLLDALDPTAIPAISFSGFNDPVEDLASTNDPTASSRQGQPTDAVRNDGRDIAVSTTAGPVEVPAQQGPVLPSNAASESDATVATSYGNGNTIDQEVVIVLAQDTDWQDSCGWSASGLGNCAVSLFRETATTIESTTNRTAAQTHAEGQHAVGLMYQVLGTSASDVINLPDQCILGNGATDRLGSCAMLGAEVTPLDEVVQVGRAARSARQAGRIAPDTAGVDIHAFGNASGPRAPRAGVDFEVGSDGMVVPQSGPLPIGASTFADPAQSGLTGIHHSIPAGTEMPPGFGIVADGVDVVPGSPHAATHHTIFPTQPMTPERFCAGFQCLPWERAGKIK